MNKLLLVVLKLCQYVEEDLWDSTFDFDFGFCLQLKNRKDLSFESLDSLASELVNYTETEESLTGGDLIGISQSMNQVVEKFGVLMSNETSNSNRHYKLRMSAVKVLYYFSNFCMQLLTTCMPSSVVISDWLCDVSDIWHWCFALVVQYVGHSQYSRCRHTIVV